MNVSDELANAALRVIVCYCAQFNSDCEGCTFDVTERGGCILQDGVVPEKLEKYRLTGEE